MQRMSVRINMTVSNKIIAIQAGVVSSVLKFTRPLVQPSRGIKLDRVVMSETECYIEIHTTRSCGLQQREDKSELWLCDIRSRD